MAHVDLNFGCPVPKVTRKGGGAALPWKRRAARRDPRGGGAGGRAARRPGDDEDPQGHRRRPPDLPRRRSDRPGERGRGDRAARPHRHPGLHAARPTGTPSVGSSSTSTSRCSATATSGRPTTPCAWSSRPGPPASWSAGAAWAGRGCSATWPLRSPAPGPRGGCAATVSKGAAVAGRGAAMMRRHAELLVRYVGDELGGCQELRKHVAWYLKGFPVGGELRRALALVETLDGLDRCWPSSTPTRRSRCSSSASHGVARAARDGRSRCPRTGSATPTGPACSRTPGRPRAAERATRRPSPRFGRAARGVAGSWAGRGPTWISGEPPGTATRDVTPAAPRSRREDPPRAPSHPYAPARHRRRGPHHRRRGRAGRAGGHPGGHPDHDGRGLGLRRRRCRPTSSAARSGPSAPRARSSARRRCSCACPRCAARCGPPRR